jgi:hypothetical protein
MNGPSPAFVPVPRPDQRRSRRGPFALLLGLLLLAGCGGFSPDDFEGSQPAFVPEEYFRGDFKVYGLFLDRFGKPRRQFVADVEGRSEGDVLILDERFQFADGETDTRVWRIRKVGEGLYEGEANDVIGTAEGRVIGQALNFSYDVDLEIGDGSWRVHFDDWLLLQPDGVVINRAIVTKWGFEVGRLLAFFTPVDRAGSAGG